jgi:peptidoglycan hydrolase-like protein with peptidoglycan-binding domain
MQKATGQFGGVTMAKPVLVAVCLGTLALSVVGQSADTVSVGVLSYIEIDPLPGAVKEDPARGPLGAGIQHAFVEVIHTARWKQFQACTKAGKANCNTPGLKHEWSVPFIPDQNSDKLEEALSKAWNRFDARTIWRLNSIINSGPEDYGLAQYSYNTNCLVPNGASPLRVDPILGAWDKSLTASLDRDEFCDALTPQPAPTHVPGLQCALYNENSPPTIIFWPEVKRRYDAALKHSDATYYLKRYWESVNDAIDRFMPWSLNWDGVYSLGNVAAGTMGGSVIQPVYANQPQTTQYANLGKAAQSKDPRGYTYILQRYPYAGFSVNKSLLKPATGEQLGAEPPAIPALEELKRTLPKRRDIFATQWQWASPITARPTGTKGLGDLREYEGVGHTTFVRAFAQQDQEYSPRAVRLIVQCMDGPFSRLKPVTISNGTQGRYPVKFLKTRAHTGWMSVPEGYEIYHVRGIPANRVPTTSPAFVAPSASSVSGSNPLPAVPSTNTAPKPTQAKPSAPQPPSTPKPPSAPTSKPAAPTNALNWQNVKPGDQDCNVATVQYALRAQGINVPLTGNYDAATKAAVQGFQRSKGLTGDGMVGSQTWEQLYVGTKRGDTGNGVAALQFTLQRMGYYKGSVDGNFGTATETAVREFQTANGIQSNGIAGRNTWNALVNAGCSSTPSGGTGNLAISAKGKQQMRDLLSYARGHNSGASRGRCMEYVWRYMTESGYGNLNDFGDLPGMDGNLARGLPDYLNGSQAHLDEAGLQRLDSTLNPPITSPHDPRIPAGAIIVVAAGSYGTSHPTAGDIVVKGDRPGEFINDGPNMSYGTSSSWYGQVRGVYVPK